MKTRISMASAAALFCLSAGWAGAASITGDDFTLAVSEAGTAIGNASGTAGDPDAVDISDSFADRGSFFNFDIDWIDDDSVDITFFMEGARDLTDLVIELADLDFDDGGAAAPITAVSFNRDASDIDDFIGDEDSGQPPLSDFAEPVLSFTDTSFAASFPFFVEGLAADGPRLRYDVTAGEDIAPPPDPAVVPLPATALLLLAGLGGIGALRRRR